MQEAPADKQDGGGFVFFVLHDEASLVLCRRPDFQTSPLMVVTGE